MANNVLPQDWQLPDWHADFGDAHLELDALRSLAIAICESFPNAMATLEIPEPGLVTMRIAMPNEIVAEIHSVPSIQHADRRRFAIFVSPNTAGEIEQYADSVALAVDFLKDLTTQS